MKIHAKNEVSIRSWRDWVVCTTVGFGHKLDLQQALTSYREQKSHNSIKTKNENRTNETTIWEKEGVP